MRHAHSGHPGGVLDHDRPLTGDGRTDAGLAGEWLRAHLEPVQETLCSTATRARQTAAATGLAVPVRFDADLYDAAPAGILGPVRATAGSVRTLLVVGHAPGVPALAEQLITRWPAGDGRHDAAEAIRARFPTAAMAVLQFRGEWSELDDGGARLTFFRIPPA